MNILIYIVVIFILILTFIRPYLGLVFTTASLLLIDILPDVPLLSSVFPLLGGFTFLSFIINSKDLSAARVFRFTSNHIISLLFISWIFVSNPEAAWFGRDRNWIITYIQLWVLLWLAGALLDTPKKHHALMWVYSIASIASALVSLQQGVIGEDIDSSIRAFGLTEAVNTAARYFIVAMVFLIYLRTVSRSRLIRLFATVGVILTILGTLLTVSRSGIILLVAAFGLLIWLQPSGKYRFQIMAGFVILLVMVWFFADNIVKVASAILPAVSQGTDTIGMRFTLWKVGWRMWLDHPIAGVGVGMFMNRLAYYGPEIMRTYGVYRAVAHNMYIAVLAETGAVGFGLFMFIIFKTWQNIWRGGKLGDPVLVQLRNVWFIVFMIMLLGGMTKTDQADKLLWLIMGIGVFFENQWKMSKAEKRGLKHENITP